MYDLIRKASQNQALRHSIAKITVLIPAPVLIWLCQCAAGLIRLRQKDLYHTTLRNMIKILHPYYRLKTIRAFCGEYFVNHIITLAEILFLSTAVDKKLDRIISVTGKEHLDSVLKQGRGAILFSSHTGNFFYYYYFLSRHYPSLVVATALDEDLRQLYLIFHRMGCQGLDYDSTNKKKMLTTIKQHLSNNGVVVLLGDFWRQHFPHSTMFGKTTRSPHGAAGLALDLQVPILPFYGFRTYGLKHELVFSQPVWLNEQFSRRDKAAATDYLNTFLEYFILHKPSQWFYWFNSSTRWESDHTMPS